MSFTGPRGGFPVPLCTSDFLRAFVGARFQVDHLVLPSGASASPAIRGSNPGTWTRMAPGGATATYSLTLDTFRILQASTANSDGTYTVSTEITMLDGTVIPSGTVGVLQAVTEPTGQRIAIPCSVAVVAQVAPSEPAAAEPAAVTAKPATATKRGSTVAPQ